MKKSLITTLIIALALLGFSCARKDASEASNSGSKGASAASDSGSKSTKVKEEPSSDHDFKYDLTKDGTGIEIKGYTGNHTNLIIPKTIEGYPVKVIRIISTGGWFQDSNRSVGLTQRKDTRNIQTVVVPEGVEGVGGFNYMTKLRKVVLPDTVSVIGTDAFEDCSSLTEINIPAGIKEIGNEAFRGCGGLYDLHIPKSITSIEFKVSGNWTPAHFYGCQKLPIATRQRLKDLGYTGSF